jgi:hypothetical protein
MRRTRFEQLEARLLLFAPAAPSGLAATPVSHDQIDLSWTDNADNETAYVVERSPAATGQWTTLAENLAPGSTAYRDQAGLAEDTAYDYRVTAINLDGASGYAATAARTLLAAPASPSLALGAVADTYVQQGTPETNYGSGAAINVKKDPGASGDLTRHGFLKFELAGAPSGLASAQLRINGKISDTSTTNIPTDLYAVADTTWQESGTGGMTWNTRPASGSALLASVVVADTTYAWYTFDVSTYVQAEKSAGRNTISLALKNPVSSGSLNGFRSREASADRPQLLLVPSGAAAQAISTTRIDVSWTDNTGHESGYAVERSIDNVHFELVGMTVANATSFTDTTGLAEGTTYYYRVRAVTAGNASAWLAGAVTMTLPAEPSAPTLSQGNGGVGLTWVNHSPGATGYVVERSLDCLSWLTIANVDGVATEYLDPAPPIEGSIYYRVRAANRGGVSAPSPVGSIFYSAPLAPSGLVCSYPTPTQFDLAWTDHSANELGFKIERSPDGQTAWSQIGTTGANVTAFSDPDRALFARCFYRVRAYNAVGDSAPTPAVVADRLEILRQEGLNTIASVEAALARSASDLGIRLLSQAAYAALALDVPGAAAKAETFLRAAFDKQLPDGNFGWSWSDTTNTDRNSVEFTMLPAAVVFVRYADRLSPAFREYAHAHLQLAISAIESHSVGVDYTNIYTMKLVNLLLLGQVENDAAARAAGAANLQTWLADLRREGVHEYDGPIYAIVTYNNLLAGYNNTADTTARRSMKTGLDYLAADLAANYFGAQAGGKLAGAHARDYDFLTGLDDVDHLYYIEGLRSAPPAVSNFNHGLYTYLNVLEAGYHPPQALWAELAAPAERVVKQVFGPASGQDRYSYLTADFALGSASSYYGPQDKQIALDLASSKLLTQITLVEDQFDSPYGNVQTTDVSGHKNATHLKNSMAAVQEKGLLLAASNLGPQFSFAPTQTYTSLGSNLVFPANADHLYLDGTEITDRSGTIAAHVGAVLGIREANSIVAVRLFHADGLADQTPSVVLRFDGSAWNAARLVAYHYQGPERAFVANTLCRVGLLVTAQHCTSDVEAAAFLESVRIAPLSTGITDGVWTTSTVVSGVTLDSALNVTSNSVVYRRVEGSDYQRRSFALSDGLTTRDLADELLFSLDVDGNGAADALTDGILALRYLFNPTGDWSTADAVGPGAARSARQDIRALLDGCRCGMLDVDGNGTADALTDGILILRYLFAPPGQWTVSDALGAGATRTSRDTIRAYLDRYNPTATPQGTPTIRNSAAPAAGVDVQKILPPTDELHGVQRPIASMPCPELASDVRSAEATCAPWRGTPDVLEDSDPAWACGANAERRRQPTEELHGAQRPIASMLCPELAPDVRSADATLAAWRGTPDVFEDSDLAWACGSNANRRRRDELAGEGGLAGIRNATHLAVDAFETGILFRDVAHPGASRRPLSVVW